MVSEPVEPAGQPRTGIEDEELHSEPGSPENGDRCTDGPTERSSTSQFGREGHGHHAKAEDHEHDKSAIDPEHLPEQGWKGFEVMLPIEGTRRHRTRDEDGEMDQTGNVESESQWVHAKNWVMGWKTFSRKGG